MRDKPRLEFDHLKPKTPFVISWSAAASAIASGQSEGSFVTLPWWQDWIEDGVKGWIDPPAEERPLMGEHHNENCVARLRKIKPFGVTADGHPWFAAVLYAAPPDPEWGYGALVGVMSELGHIACLLPGNGKTMRPIVESLAINNKYFALPLIANDQPQDMYIKLPRRGYLRSHPLM